MASLLPSAESSAYASPTRSQQPCLSVPRAPSSSTVSPASLHRHCCAQHYRGRPSRKIAASALQKAAQSAQHRCTLRQSSRRQSCCSVAKRMDTTGTRCSATQIEDLAAAHYQEAPAPPSPTLIATIATAETVAAAVEEIAEAKAVGAEVVELRLDYLQDLALNEPGPQLEELLGACKSAGLPAIVTFRPKWEGGRFDGQEATRLAILKYASTLGPAYIDVELLAADFFFAGTGTVPIGTNVILSHHDYKGTPTDQQLDSLVAKMFQSGADVAKIATTATDVSDSLRMLQLPDRSEGPVIALAMGERGLPSRLLAPKYGSHLTFGCLSAERGSAPGQPTVEELRSLYHLPSQKPSTQVFGVIGNPVSHSRSPSLHNAAFASGGVDAVYIPLLVDDVASFLRASALPGFDGFSVTIPHKLAALAACTEVDPVAQRIGAVNTLLRKPDGSLKGLNTDWSAAIDAIEAGLRENPESDCDPEGCSLDFGDSWDEEEPQAGPSSQEAAAAVSDDEPSPLDGLRVVVLGAGGAGRALAFGAAVRGAHVVVANRNRERADELVAALGGSAEAADLSAVASGEVSGSVLANTTSVGMHPNDGESPVPQDALINYRLVFDAIYTPLETRLLKDAAKVGCATVGGLEMFVGQAVQQFQLFTRKSAPEDVMRDAVLKSLKA